MIIRMMNCPSSKKQWAKAVPVLLSAWFSLLADPMFSLQIGYIYIDSYLISYMLWSKHGFCGCIWNMVIHHIFSESSMGGCIYIIQYIV
jgi:hypothetical protein